MAAHGSPCSTPNTLPHYAESELQTAEGESDDLQCSIPCMSQALLPQVTNIGRVPFQMAGHYDKHP